MAVDLFLLLLRPTSRDEYTEALLAVLYGGTKIWRQPRRFDASQLVPKKTMVSIFPDLPRFEHLVREIVQAPLQALPAALMARELAFRNLTGASETETSRELAKEHVYLSKFVILAATYLTKALRLPTEFAEVYIGQMSEIQSAVLNGPATTV